MKVTHSSLVAWIALLAYFGPTARADESVADAAGLAHALDRLSTTARVLFVAAHPDDENTRLLAYLANGRHVTAGYLSMTRGGGGQNLIGREQDELLDTIRTQELLAARRLDGAVQRFTRMRDFGYSKSAAETLAIWGHDEALADMVWVIRTFQPDVIITRFDEQPPNHGHHTASAILAREAFTAAADATRFTDQLALGAKPWQALRLLHNLPHWRTEKIPDDALSIDVGRYDTRFGMSYGELAARSRSQHKSQGFGVPGERGELLERFVTVAGIRPKKDLLDGVELGWKRLGTTALPFAEAVTEARRQLHRDLPERALPALLKAHRALDALPDVPRVRDARAALDAVIVDASGLFVRAIATRPTGIPGSLIPITVEVVKRRPSTIALRRLRMPIEVVDVRDDLVLNRVTKVEHALRCPDDAPIATPYWLSAPMLPSRQLVSDARLIGQPEGPAPLAVRVELAFEERTLRIEAPLLYMWTDRVHGERTRRFLVVPPATVTPTRDAAMFPNGRATSVTLRVRAGADAIEGIVLLPLPDGWRSQPQSQSVKLAHAGDAVTVRFDVTPPKRAVSAEITVITPGIEVDGKRWSFREDTIDYPHIPMQVVLQSARLRLTPLALKLPEGRVGYVEGSGDTIAEDLGHVGMSVEVLDDQVLQSGDLSRFGSIVLGIRALNTREILRSVHDRLMRYVAGGGTLVVQYNTHSTREPLTTPIGPYALELGRDRVTDELAEMKILAPRHPVLSIPNRITPQDFAGWVQERGLYFAAKWDAPYEPIFELADPNEAPARGALLVARHGKGRFVYTGLSFFRQLPAGVPGAYRLLLNLLAR